MATEQGTLQERHGACWVMEGLLCFLARRACGNSPQQVTGWPLAGRVHQVLGTEWVCLPWAHHSWPHPGPPGPMAPNWHTGSLGMWLLVHTSWLVSNQAGELLASAVGEGRVRSWALGAVGEVTFQAEEQNVAGLRRPKG